MSSTWPNQSTDREEKPTFRSGPSLGAVAVLILLCLGIGYALYQQQHIQKQLAARLGELNTNLSLLQARTTTLEETYSILRSDADVTAQKLGVNEQQLARARALAQQIKKEEQRNVAQLKTQLEEHQNQLGSLSGTVGEVKGDVAETRQTLEATVTKLDHAVGDLGVQSGLIAHTREELEVLKRRGERDYFEFDIRKSKQFARVGDIPVRLVKADPKRSRYTLTMLVNDKRIEKKDKTLYEPVQFYPQKSHNLLEIVVFELDKDRVAGYLSVPKEMAMRQTNN